MKYSIALSFQTETLEYSKVSSLISMFHQSAKTHMATLNIPFVPSFDLDSQTSKHMKDEFIQTLSERLEEQWYGHDRAVLVSLNSLHFVSSKKRHELYLNMGEDGDFNYAQEVLYEELQEVGAFFQNEKKALKNFSPRLEIGQFQYEEQLSTALEYIKSEIKLPIHLQALKFSLYENKGTGQSFLSEDLFYFHKDKR